MKTYVLDASVAAKWFLPVAHEPLADDAIRLLDRYVKGEIGFRVPDLFWAEFGNVLWKAVRAGRISRESAEEALVETIRRKIPTAPASPLLQDAFVIAATFGRTVYDSLYVALANASGIPLITADERLVTAMAARFSVRWLGAL